MHQFSINNSAIKNLFVCEFITAGGLNHSELPITLAHEGMLMRDALLRDLTELPYHIVTPLDARLKPPQNCDYVQINAGDNVWPVWQHLMQKADAVWLIAPETNGVLEQLTALATHMKKPIFGSGLRAISVASSKLNTFNTLNRHTIPILPTYTIDEYMLLTDRAGQWVVKPDDGAGCEQTYLFNDSSQLLHWLSLNETKNMVIQPYISGKSGSISCAIYQGVAHVLSCNQQLISIESGVFSYQGSIINAMCEYWAACEALVNNVARAIPELAGYVGIDFVVTDEGGEVVLIEINPRLTTSYTGLAAATGYNPASLIINLMTQNNFAWPILQKNKVSVNI